MDSRHSALRIMLLAFALLSYLVAAEVQTSAQVASTSGSGQVIERGKLRFFDTKQPQGEENYTITRDGRGLVLESKLELALQEKDSLTATLVMDSDFSARKFELKGKKPSGSGADLRVEVLQRLATIREGNKVRQTSVPQRFFTASGYAPLAVEMMLVRYWLRHPGSGPLGILPIGEVKIERRGRDTITITGKKELERYSLDGLAWGRQTLWMDGDNLAAVVGIGGDVESTLPVVREGFEAALPFFIKRAAQDSVEQFTETASRLSPRQNGPLAIVGGTLIDGTGSAPMADSVVLIEGDRITAAGPRSQVNVPKGARVLEAMGKYILPGLWDMHAHFFKAEFGPVYLASGVTTVRDVGNEFEFITTLRDAFRKGRGLGPSILLAGYIEGKNDQHSFDIQVDTPEEARAAVKHYKDAGFEQIKIRDQIKPEILRVIADEAHRVGITLTGHVPSVMNAIQAVEAGQDQICHINFVAPVLDFKRGPSGGFAVDPEGLRTKRALESFKQHHTIVDPTLVTFEMMLRDKGTPISSFEPGFAKISPEYAEHLSNQVSSLARLNALPGFLSVVGVLHRAGIPIVAGTDVVVPGHSLHHELELFVKAGFTPLEAIQAATIIPARAMKVDKQVGTIEKGKRADLVILDANPLESISNIRKIKSVVVRGRIFDSARLWQAAGFQP